MTDHATLVVEPLLEVPQPAAPEVCGTLTEEGRQLGLKDALNVRMPPLAKHSPYILILQLPSKQALVLWLQGKASTTATRCAGYCLQPLLLCSGMQCQCMQ